MEKRIQTRRRLFTSVWLRPCSLLLGLDFLPTFSVQFLMQMERHFTTEKSVKNALFCKVLKSPSSTDITTVPIPVTMAARFSFVGLLLAIMATSLIAEKLPGFKGMKKNPNMSRFTQQEKQFLLDTHNAYRRAVAKGRYGARNGATNMREMVIGGWSSLLGLLMGNELVDVRSCIRSMN